MIDLKLLNFNAQTQKAKFKQTIDLTSLRWWGNNPINEPVEVSGEVERVPDGYTLNYTAEYTSTMPCARCLKEVERRFSPSFNHLLRESYDDADEEDGCIFINKDKLDLERVVSSDIMFELGDVTLCSPNCKGLCQQCGADRNKTDCGCKEEKPLDPRFDVLRELLGK